jgi:transposase
MKRFVEGQDRSQVTLLPECLDDFVGPDNPVRVVDVFVDELDLASLGFDGTTPATTGRPAYKPAVLLKVYIYGYFNRVQSSRRLERECQRNVELMWLTGRLAPDFKTIADFRHDNGRGIRNVCRRFVELCRELKLFAQALVAIDGSKFKAVNSRDCNFTPGKIDKRREQIEHSIQRYLDALATADRTQATDLETKTERLNEKVERLRQRMQQLDRIEAQIKSQPEPQLSLTDRDARSMTSTGKGTGTVGYNVQMAVDARHHLIAAHEVTNVGSDRSQLHPMALAARDAMGKNKLKALADRGYYFGEQIKSCKDAGITALVPKPDTSSAHFDGRFGKADFIYIARDDQYQCPAGERAIRRFADLSKGQLQHIYWSSACPRCPIKAQCTPGEYRRIRRWEHEAVLDTAQRQLDRMPLAMTLRRQTVEHVFGTIKHWMGSTHFLTRTLVHVSTEMSLHVLAYNLKRVLSILGIARTMKAVALVGA